MVINKKFHRTGMLGKLEFMAKYKMINTHPVMETNLIIYNLLKNQDKNSKKYDRFPVIINATSGLDKLNIIIYFLLCECV